MIVQPDNHQLRAGLANRRATEVSNYPTMTKDLGIDAFWLGILFSAFSWTYALAQVPGGSRIPSFRPY
jgi:hypothetical protein